jgi:DNA polymerase III subunit delta'
LPKAVARGEVAALGDVSPAQAIDILQKICHDLVAVRAGAEPRFFEPADLPPAAQMDALGAWWRELGREQRTAEHPFNAGLMLEALVSRARSALHSTR